MDYATPAYKKVVLFDAGGTTITVPAVGLEACAVDDQQEWAELIDDTREMYRRRCAAEVLTSYGPALAQVRAWQAAGTTVRMVALGFDRHDQWYEPAVPVLAPRTVRPGQTSAQAITLLSRDLDADVFTQRANLLRYLGWSDGDGDELPDNWLLGLGVDTGTSSFGSGVFSMDYANNGAACEIYAFVPLPLPGVAMTMLWDVRAAFDGGCDGISLGIRYADELGATIDTDGAVVANTVGIKSFALTPPVDTYQIRCSLGLSNPAGVGTIEIADPTLVVGTASDVVTW